MSAYGGVFGFLAYTPQWVTLLIALTTGLAIPFVIADQKTGLFYNFSYSGMIGDLGFLVVLFIGIGVVQRGAPLPYWFAGLWPQLLWFAVCVAIGAYLVTATTPWPIASWPDRYHNAVIAPLFLFLLPLLILATLSNGNWIEKTVTGLLIGIWAVLVLYDFAEHRINQPERLERQFNIELRDGQYVTKLRLVK